MSTLSLIVAAAENNVIGKDGNMPWHLPADLKNFKALTAGHPVIMGRATWESLPFQPLPNRTNIVITRNPDYQADEAEVCHSLAEALAIATPLSPEIFIMGGGQIYGEALPQADKIYLTRIHQSMEGDTTFPPLPENFQETAREDHLENDPPFSFLIYEKVGTASKKIPGQSPG